MQVVVFHQQSIILSQFLTQGSLVVRTILVVEDSTSERELISQYLQQGGYNVIAVASAQDALDKVNTQRPDMVVTDLVMPGMSGYELCRTLRNNPAMERVPVVVCSSKDQKIDRLWAMKQGANAYITKPFTQEDLLRSVKAMVV